MEPLYCVNISLVGYEGQMSTGHVIFSFTHPDEPRETESVDLEVPAVAGELDVRLWAKRVLALALAEL